MYAEKLIDEGIISNDDVTKIVNDHTAWLTDELKNHNSFEPDVSVI